MSELRKGGEVEMTDQEKLELMQWLNKKMTESYIVRATSEAAVYNEVYCHVEKIITDPRVMTLEEVAEWHNIPESKRDPIYVEYRPNSGLGISHWTTEYFGFNPNSYPNKHSGYYGKWLRCWTSRPDEKRRAETPWDS